MIKKILKALFWLLLLFVIGFSVFLYEQNKDGNDKKNTTSNLEKISALKRNQTKDSKNVDEKNSLTNYENSDNVNSNNELNDNQDPLINNDNPSDENKDNNINKEYDTYNFDMSLLLFEGKKDGKEVNKLLDRMLENSQNNLYTNTSVSYRNGGDTITSNYSYKDNNINEYVSNINAIKNNIAENSNYNISFGYSKDKSHVNEIIIEKV